MPLGKVGIITSILHVHKLRLGEAQSFVQGLTVNKWFPIQTLIALKPLLLKHDPSCLVFAYLEGNCDLAQP